MAFSDIMRGFAKTSELDAITRMTPAAAGEMMDGLLGDGSTRR